MTINGWVVNGRFFIDFFIFFTIISAMKTFEEIKNIIQKHKDEIREKYKVKKIGVFGSYIRGVQTPKSDIDILVSFNETISLLKLAGLEIYLEDILGVKTEVVPKEDIRQELRKNILESVVYL